MLEIIIGCGIIASLIFGYNMGYAIAEENQKRTELEMENVILKEVLEDELF